MELDDLRSRLIRERQVDGWYTSEFAAGVDAVLAVLVPVGVDYCPQHHGLRNEDDHWCNGMTNEDCPECAGTGRGEDDDDCPCCGGDGHSPCALSTLYRIAAAPIPQEDDHG